MSPETHPVVSTFESPSLFELQEAGVPVRVESVTERIDYEDSSLQQPLGRTALQLSAFRAHELLQLADYGPMH